MKTQNSALNAKGVNTESKNAVKNANTTQRVVVTRNEYDVVFDHAVSLVVAYSRGQQVEKPREGFAFGPASNGSHTRNYAKSLIWGFATSKAGKVLKDLDDLSDKAKRVKIAIAILTDCSLVKGDSKAIEASLAKVEPKRERVFAFHPLFGGFLTVFRQSDIPHDGGDIRLKRARVFWRDALPDRVKRVVCAFRAVGVVC